MAHEAKLSLFSVPSVAGETIEEGRLVRLVASGIRNDLAVAKLAASGTTINVYVAFAAPDNFSRPTPGQVYTAPSRTQWYESDSWGNPTQTDTWYFQGLSTFEAPIIASGYVMLAKREGTYTVTSGCVISSASIQTVGNLVKVADDGTGRWDVTTLEANAIGTVVDYDPALLTYTFRLNK